MLAFSESGEGPAVIWIQGFPFSGRIFEPQLPIPGFRHLLPDLPGFGRSPAGESASMRSYAAAILELLDHLNLRTAVFAGLSMGGYIVLEIARQAPERFDAAILLDTREGPDTAEGRAGRYEMIEKVRTAGTRPVIDSMLPKMLTPAGSRFEPFVREIMESASREGVIGGLSAMAERPDSTETLRRLDVPVLIVVGSDDPITPPADAERMAGLAPQAQLVVVPEASHLANIEQAGAVNAAVGAFLARAVAGRLQG
jgi:pimeloyl-ACP methyl ester carboxylesterase